MSENVKSNIKFTIILLVLIALTGVGISLAYFAANVTQSASSKVEVHAVEGLAINYDNGSTINIGNFIPGSSTKKTFSATLTNKKLAFSVTYNVMMKITSNGFDTNAGELTYSLKKNNSVVASGTISGTGTKTLLANSTITGNTSSNTTTDSFELTITYPNLNRVQTQGAAFSGSVYFGTGTNKIDSNTVEDYGETIEVIEGSEYEYPITNPQMYIDFLNSNKQIAYIEAVGEYSAESNKVISDRIITVRAYGTTIAGGNYENCRFNDAYIANQGTYDNCYFYDSGMELDGNIHTTNCTFDSGYINIINENNSLINPTILGSGVITNGLCLNIYLNNNFTTEIQYSSFASSKTNKAATCLHGTGTVNILGSSTNDFFPSYTAQKPYAPLVDYKDSTISLYIDGEPKQ